MPTLDIPERQLLVDFFDDENGFLWHHRILMVHVTGTVWIVVTPDLSVQQLDVATKRLVVLPRNGPFPADRAAATYACDPADFTPAEVARLRAEAQAMAEILNGGPQVVAAAPVAGQEVWRVSDTSHASFGEEVPPAALANPDAFKPQGEVATVLLDGQWTTAAKESAGSPGLVAFKARFHSGAGRDRRLLCDTRDSDGRRHITLVACIPLLCELVMSFWPVDGPRSVREFLVALRTAGYSGLMEYHHDWVRNSGIGEKSSVCREHKFLLELLRVEMEFDQLDVSSLGSSELLVRRVYQIEIAVERSPKQPDFDGLEPLLETSLKSSGAVNVVGISKWFSEHQKSEAFVLKQMRLWAEEKKEANKDKSKK